MPKAEEDRGLAGREPVGPDATDRHARAHLRGQPHTHVRLDPSRPVYVISVAASMLRVHPRTLRIYEGEGLVCPARTPSNIRLYSENDIRRIVWIRHLTQNLGVNLAGIRILFELEERLGTRILESLITARPEGDSEVDYPGARVPQPAPSMAGSTTRSDTDQGDLDVRHPEAAGRGRTRA